MIRHLLYFSAMFDFLFCLSYYHFVINNYWIFGKKKKMYFSGMEVSNSTPGKLSIILERVASSDCKFTK